VGGILANRNAQRISFRLDVRERADSGSRVDHEDEPVPARIDGDDAHRKGRTEQADAAIGLREHRRGIDESQIDAIARGDLLGENRRTGGQPQPRPERRAGAAADRDDHVAIAAIRGRWITREVQADLPERLGANEICAFRQWFHGGISSNNANSVSAALYSAAVCGLWRDVCVLTAIRF
jgi:hypothetical protein